MISKISQKGLRRPHKKIMEKQNLRGGYIPEIKEIRQGTGGKNRFARVKDKCDVS